MFGDMITTVRHQKTLCRGGLSYKFIPHRVKAKYRKNYATDMALSINRKSVHLPSR